MKTPITTIVIDSNPKCIRDIHEVITSNCPEIQIAGHAGSIAEATQLIRHIQPELVFLDILLQDAPIIALYEENEYKPFNIVVTYTGKQSLNKLKYGAFDYLSKPIKSHELICTVHKHREIIALKKELQKLKDKNQKTIGLSNLNEIQFVHLDNIIRLEAASNYTHFHLGTGEKITVSYTLKHYEEILAHDDFMRVHQSHIINLNKVKKYIKGSGGYAVMEDGQSICISPTKKSNFFKALHLA